MTDTGLPTGLLPFLGGAMTLAGAILVFVNARLQEATTPEARSRVVMWTILSLTAAFNLAAVAASFVLDSYLTVLALFAVPLALQIILFLRDPQPIRRLEVFALCFIFSAFTFLAAAALTLHFTTRLYEVFTPLLKQR